MPIKKGLTPVLSMVLLLLIAVASTGIIYTFYTKLQKGTQSNIQKTTSNMQQKIQQQMNTNFNIESAFITTDGYIGLSIRNTGNSQLCLNYLTFYLNGQIIPQDKIKVIMPKSSDCINPGQIMVLNLTSYDYPVEGHTDNLKITSTSGITNTYTVVGKKVDVDKGLVLFYNFDSGNPKTVFDRSGNGNNGIIYGNPSYVDGVEGKALKFDGVDDYVKLKNNLLPTKGTIVMWFKTDAANGVLFSMQNAQYPNTPYYWVPVIYILNGYLRGEYGWYGAINPISTSFKVNDGTFHMAVLIYNGTNDFLYVDGKYINSREVSSTFLDMAYQYIGTGYASGGWGLTGWSFFNGTIDDVRIYNRSLTDRQIKYLFCQGAYNLQQKGEFNMPSWCKEYLP